MGIEEKINADIKTAMLAKEQGKLEALRAIKSVVIILKTSPEGLTEDAAMKALQKEVKKRRETAEIYNQQNRKDLTDVEIFQAGIIEQYLPKQMSEADLRAALAQLIKEVGASSPADMGKVMGAATKKFAGQADGKMISSIVKELLATPQ
ncbi:MAG: GatB/YqeY domain-containing protein [Bacteroidetes bacterium]|nr:GatB/YqeY domain-containing protein [Bacteroidota bacterium]